MSSRQYDLANYAVKTSENGRRFIEQWEEDGKPLLAARWDSLGRVWEIGFGHTSAAGLPRVQPHSKITAEEADAILASDLAAVEVDVNHHVVVPLNQNQFDALVSFDFNTGGLSRSGVLRAVNSNQFDAVARDLKAWSHAGGQFVQGLYNRRIAEGRLFNESPLTVA